MAVEIASCAMRFYGANLQLPNVAPGFAFGIPVYPLAKADQ